VEVARRGVTAPGDRPPWGVGVRLPRKMVILTRANTPQTQELHHMHHTTPAMSGPPLPIRHLSQKTRTRGGGRHRTLRSPINANLMHKRISPGFFFATEARA
jgi:hypothetical protein